MEEKILDGLTQKLFGRSRNAGVCVTCGSAKVLENDFRNQVSWREYGISRMCQKCQDEIFQGGAE